MKNNIKSGSEAMFDQIKNREAKPKQVEHEYDDNADMDWILEEKIARTFLISKYIDDVLNLMKFKDRVSKSEVIEQAILAYVSNDIKHEAKKNSIDNYKKKRRP